MFRKLSILMALLVVMTLLASACQPTPAVVKETVPVEVTKEVVVKETVPVEVTKEVVVKETVPVEVTKVVEVPVETKPGADPNRVLNLYAVQHAMCAWDSFWCTVEEGIRRAADDMNVNVTVLGPDKFDLERVAQLIDQAV
ncbi:MAG: hypothetical protein ACUVWZ_11900, partial [Anaerolineae bacterium]